MSAWEIQLLTGRAFECGSGECVEIRLFSARAAIAGVSAWGSSSARRAAISSRVGARPLGSVVQPLSLPGACLPAALLQLSASLIPLAAATAMHAHP